MSTLNVCATAPQSAPQALSDRLAVFWKRLDAILDSRESYHQALSSLNAKPARLAE